MANQPSAMSIARAITILVAAGYERPRPRQDLEKLTAPIGWFTPKELAAQAGLSPAGIWRRLHHHACPPFERETGETGRIIRVEATKLLMDFLLQPKSSRLRHWQASSSH